MNDKGDRHPVMSGLTALLGVGLAVGLLLGVAAFVGVRALGVGGGGKTTAGEASASLYLPSPTDPNTVIAPSISVAPAGVPSDAYSLPAEDGGGAYTSGASLPVGITLSTGQVAVGVGQRIDLSGVAPDGTVLTVQRMDGGQWTDFAGLTAHVRGGGFQTWVQTGRPGEQQWRVLDKSSGQASNPVTVRVG